MCGRYTNTAGVEELSDRFQVPITSAVGTGRFNVAPTEDVLAIVSADGAAQARALRWGLVPWWSKDLKGSARMINARLETLTDKPAFRELLPHASRRALQLADGYFEWLRPERRDQPRQPFYFQVDGGTPFAFASLWTRARVDGAPVESVTMITCDSSPNPVVAAIHGRMPVILADREAQRAWLDEALGAREALELCGALAPERISARPVDPAVNSVNAPEGPQLLAGPSSGGR